MATKNNVNKEALVEAIGGGNTVVTADPELAQLVLDLAAFREIQREAEKRGEELKARAQAALLALHAAAISTPGGLLVGSVKSREGLDKTRIPVEILEAATTSTTYVQVDVKPARAA